MQQVSGAVAVLALPGSSLAIALAASLAAKGWIVHRALDPATVSALAAGTLLAVLADDAGTALEVRPAMTRTPARHWICLGTLDGPAELAGLARRGATVLNPDLPYLVLLQRVEAALTAGVPRRIAPPAAVAGLVQRTREGQALQRLTVRERTVLCQLMQGRTVAQIALEGGRAVHTVRSQVQSLLRRLDVNSQVEAVAVAHRAGRRSGLADCLDALHQY